MSAKYGYLMIICLLSILIYFLLLNNAAVHLSEVLCEWPDAFYSYVEQQNNLVALMESDCDQVWKMNNGEGPRLLVHDCQLDCGGFGDRMLQISGAFLLALLTNRSFFINHQKPDLEKYFDHAYFPWQYTGKVKECLEYGRTRKLATLHSITPNDELLASTGIFKTVKDYLFSNGISSAMNYLPHASVFLIKTYTNSIRPFQLYTVFQKGVSFFLFYNFEILSNIIAPINI